MRLEVYDVLGQRVRTLVFGNLASGSHRVVRDGRDDRGVQVGSGTYVYRMQAGGLSLVRRMVLLK